MPRKDIGKTSIPSPDLLLFPNFLSSPTLKLAELVLLSFYGDFIT